VRAPEKPSQVQTKKSRRWRWLLLAAVIGAAMFYWRQGNAARLFEAAKAEFQTHPERAEKLLEQSVIAAGGSYPEAQLLRCRALGAMGHWQEALGLFSLIDEPEQCDSRELLLLAEEAERSGIDALALLALGAADRPGPKQAVILKRRIGLELKEGSIGDLLDHCKRLERLDPEDPFPWQLEGQLMRRRKQPIAAVRAYLEALKRKPSELQRLSIRVEMVGQLIEGGDLAAAREEMDWLLGNPATAEAVRMKDAYLLRLEGRLDEALAQTDVVLAHSPDPAPALTLRGILQLDLARYAEAADDLSRVAKLQPYNKEARYKLAQAYLKLDRPDDAAKELKASQKLTEAQIEILALEPKLRQNRSDRELRDRLAKLYRQVGREDDAERLIPSPATGE
jgi:Flp pilus assembly protein TadD